MTFQYVVKSFTAGMLFPGVFMPLAYSALYFSNPELFQSKPLQFIPLYVPLLFGITNVIYLWIGNRCPIEDINWRLWTTGASLGIIVAWFGVFVFNLPFIVFGLSHSFQYLPLVVLPIIYGIIFRYFVKWLNHIFGV